MPVAAPPRAPEDADEPDLDERVAELEALIEEARRRARRRRAAVAMAAVAVAAAVAALVGIDGPSGVSVGRSVVEDAPAGAATTSSNGRWGPPSGPEGGGVVIAVDPRDPAIVYAAGSGFVAKTTNGGRSWRTLPAPQPWGRASALVADPRRPATVYLATERGILKTKDGGRTWQWMNTGLFDGETVRRREHRLIEGFAEEMIVDGHQPGTVFLSTFARGLFRTTDGGARWSVVGPPHVSGPGYNVEVAIDPGSSGVVYASWPTYRPDSPANLYRSSDGGSSWQPIDVRGKHPWFGSLTVDPHHAGTLYAAGGHWGPAGIWKSDDGAATWRVVGLANERVTSHWIETSTRATVFATTETGVFTSHDHGASWRRLGEGTLPGSASVVSTPRAPETLYGPADGVVKSVDGGRTWRSVNNGLVATGVESLTVAVGSPGVLLAGTWEGVHTSTDGGRSWSPARSAVKPSRIASLAAAVEQQGGTIVYAGTTGRGAFKSLDGGRSWQRLVGLPAEIVTALAIDQAVPRTVYAGAAGGVYKTIDGGTTWKATPLRAHVLALALDPLAVGTVFAGTTGGLVRSTDGGDRWELVASAARIGVSLDRGVGNPGAFEALAIDPMNPETVYAGIRTGGIVKSLDGGDTWAPANAGRTRPVDALAIDPRDPRVLYVAGDGGVYRSADGARSWMRFERGLPALSIRALAVSPDGRTVFAGTGGRGVVSFEYAR